MRIRFGGFRAGAAAGLALWLALALPLTGCSKKDDSGGTKPGTSTAALAGLVTQSGTGTAISGATVTSSGGGSTTTDGNGRFTLSIPANQNVQVNVTKAGFTLNQLLVNLAANQTSTTTVGLLPTGNTASVPVASGGMVTDPSSNATIDLPADFVTASGPVTVTITGLDPTTSQITALPGGLEAVDGTGATKYLTPVSFAEYTVKDAAGNTLQFNSAAASGADIELPIPASLVGQPGYGDGDPIECYVYDPADGKWKTPVPGVIGPSSVNGDLAIKATIFHLSWYGGAPASDDVACVSGVVRDENGDPVAGVHVEAYPGGSATTNAQGQYQVQAAANSNVHVVASKTGSGSTFLVDSEDVTTGAAGGACANADFVLAETEGTYTAYAYMGLSVDMNGDPVDLISLFLNIGVDQSQVPVDGAVVKLSDGTTTWIIPGVGSGSYAATGETPLTPPLDLVPGVNYTLTLDYSGDNVVDASGSVRFAGMPVITAPTGGSSQPASFNVTWTDAGSSVTGYAPLYVGYNTNLKAPDESSLFLTSSRTYPLGNNVPDPITQFPNPPLVAGDYELVIIAATGAFADVIGAPGSPGAANLTGPATTGYFYCLLTSETVAYSSTGVTASGVKAVAGNAGRRPSFATSRAHGFEPRIVAERRAAGTKANAQRSRASGTGGGH